jgi:hypothetical protein
VLNDVLFDVIGKRLVFPGATVSVLPGEVEATLAPGERLTIISARTQSSSLALRQPEPAGGRNERSAQGAECIPVPCSSVK